METNKKVILEMIKQDKLYDEKSFMWEDDTLVEMEDELDSNKITEGKLGEFMYERISANMGIKFLFPVVRKNKDLLESPLFTDDQRMYRRIIPNRLFEVKKMEECDFAAACELVEKNEDLYSVMSDKTEEHLGIYEGIIATEEFGNMLGSIAFIKGSDYIYQLSYAGKGNYTDIKMEKNIILKRITRSVIG